MLQALFLFRLVVSTNSHVILTVKQAAKYQFPLNQTALHSLRISHILFPHLTDVIVFVQYQESRAGEGNVVLLQLGLLGSLVMWSGSDRSRSERVERRCVALGWLKDDITHARDPVEF